MPVNIEELIYRLDYLGLDSGPMRQLYDKARSNSIDLSRYDHLLVTLRSECYKPFPPGSEPLSIKLLMNQVVRDIFYEGDSPAAPAIQMHEVKAMVEEVVTAITPAEDTGNNEAMVELLREMNSEIKSLRQQVNVPQSVENNTMSNRVDNSKVKMGSVFVDPVQSTENIKANVKIDSVKSNSNAKSKLERLKKLKGDK